MPSTTRKRLYLASTSPRRAEILASIGMDFARLVPNVDETPHHGETASDYVSRLALAKAADGFTRLPAAACDHSSPVVLGADTTVEIDDEIIGKPSDQDHGLIMLARLSGRSHRVYTGIALNDGQRAELRVNRSEVWFRDLDDREILAYWETGEPADKAGSYGIQGIGATFVRRIDGSFSGVMGLPIFETAELLREFGIDIWRSA